MAQQEEPVFDGWTPDQMRALDTPIYGPKVGLNYDGHPYVPGAVIFDHLNKITGWRWSSELVQGPNFMPIEVTDGKKGKRATLIVWCVVRVSVKTPGGDTYHHDGFGAKTSFASPERKSGLYENTPKMAMTLAIRDAAIRLGEQFGLAVMRLKEHDEDGAPVSWKDQATGDLPVWPDLVGASGGRSYMPRQAQIVVDEPLDSADGDPHEAGQPEPVADDPRTVLLGRVRQAFASAGKAGADAQAIASKALTDAGVDVPSLAAISRTAEQAEQNGHALVEDDVLVAVAEALEAAGG